MLKASFLFVLVLVTFLAGAIPNQIQYQGKLTDYTGVGENGDFDFVFRIYDVETGGLSLWFENHSSVSVTHGLFEVELGSSVPINLDFDTQYWLEIEVESSVLMPRVKLAASPYAFRAAIADSIAGGTIINEPDTFIAHWDSVRGIPADIADGDNIDTTIAQWASIRDIPPAILDGDDMGFLQLRAEANPWLLDSVTFIAGDNVTLTQTGATIEINSVDNQWSRAGSDISTKFTTDWVGVGIIAPQQRLDVNGAIHIGNTDDDIEGSIRYRAGHFQGYVADSGWVTLTGGTVVYDTVHLWAQTGRHIHLTDETDSVGIGTDAPRSKLDVEGGVAIGESYAGAHSAPGNGLIVEGEVGIGIAIPASQLHVATGTEAYLTHGGYITAGHMGDYNVVIDNDEILARHDGFASTLYLQNDGGNVDVGNNLVIHGGIDDGTDMGSVGQILSSTGGGLDWIDAPSSSDGDWEIDGTNMYSIPTGDVGIGTTTPSEKLDVHGNTKTHEIHLAAPGVTGWQNQIAWFDDDRTTINHVLYMDADDGDKLKLDMGYGGSGATRVFEFDNGSIGLGTNEPDARLHIHNGTDADTLGGGYIVLGDVGGENIVIDNNEIMARHDSSTSTLLIQLNGGDADFGGNVILRGGISDGASYGNIDQVIVSDGAGGWSWENSPHVEFINDLDDVDTAGVVDGQVLKWIAVANEWRPANDVGGATGADNWGTQVVLTDSSILGDGTPAEPLGIDWDTLDAHINRYVDLNDLRNVNDVGVSDGEVLAWIAAAGEWRPLDLDEGGLGDNWGTQIVETDASLQGDGTLGDLLSVNWDTLNAYPDTMMVLNDLKDVYTDSLNYDFKLAWDHDSSRWVGKFDNDGDMANELIDSLVWEPVDSVVDTNWRTLRIIEHSVNWDVEIPVNNDSLQDNSIFELEDVDTTDLAEGTVMRWTFIETTFVGDDTTLQYKWVPVEVSEIFAEHKISDLSDVNDSIPIDKHVLQWNAATETWGPGIDPSEFINVWQDHHGYIAPLADSCVDFRIYDFDSAMAMSIIETTGVATDTWFGIYTDRRGVAASDGYGIYSHAGTDAGIAPGSEFYGVKGVANGGHVVYGLYGDGDFPGAGGTGYGVYGRGKNYGASFRGTGANSYGIYATSDDLVGGMAAFLNGYVGVNTDHKNARFEVHHDQDGNNIPSAIFRMHDSGFDDTTYFHQKWGGGGAHERALIHAKHNGETAFKARTDGRIEDKTGFVMPVGTVVPYAGSTAPDGWLTCDGALHDTTTHNDLFHVIGYNYGGSGDSFRVPDMQGRIPVGRHSTDSDFDNLNDSGGEKTHTLTVSEIPEHNHGGSTSTNGNHYHDMPFDDGDGGVYGATGITVHNANCGGGDCGGNGLGFTNNTGNHTHTISNQGDGNAHNNLQPYRVLNYIIKY